MGVAARIVCVTCDMGGPEIGDMGHLGYPSLEDDSQLEGELASFEYLYKGYAAIGYHPKPLEAVRAFLVAHKRHRIGLFLDGEEYARSYPALTNTPASHFEFTGANFVQGHYELACGRCGEAFRTRRIEWLRPLEPRKLPKPRVQEFVSRVIDAEEANFYRVFDPLDPTRDEGRDWCEFIQQHARHSLTARTVVEERWSALPAEIGSPTPDGPVNQERRQWFWSAANVMPHPAAVAPPLTLRWTYDHAQAIREAPFVADGHLYTATTTGRGIACLSPEGDELWRLDFGRDHAIGSDHNLAVMGEKIVASMYAAEPQHGELLIIDRATGRVDRRTPFPFQHLIRIDDGPRVVAYRADYGTTQKFALALLDLTDPVRPVWCHTQTTDNISDSSFRRVAISGDRVYTEWGDDLVALRLADGEIVWRRSLVELGERSYWYPSPLSVSNETLLLDSTSGLVAFDTTNGDERWRRQSLEWCPRTVCEGVLYATQATPLVGATSSGMFAMDVATGRELARVEGASRSFARTPLSRPKFYGFPAVGLTHVFAVDVNARLWALDKTTLEPQWMIRPAGMLAPVANILVAYANRLIVKGGGSLFCLEGGQWFEPAK
jgi:outer membrane protein assembly factor BamB